MKEELQQKIEDAQVEGWQLYKERHDSAVMIRRKYGSLGAHVLVALLTAWWTLGFGNVLYAAFKYFGDAEKKVIRA